MDTNHLRDLLRGVRSLHARTLCIFRLTCQDGEWKNLWHEIESRMQPGWKGNSIGWP